MQTIRRFWCDERGQDLLEYGLLAGIIAIAGVLVFPSLGSRMGTVFSGWETTSNGLWVPLAPTP